MITLAKSIKLRENVLMMDGSTEVQKDALGCEKQKFATWVINRCGSCNWGCREQASELFHKAVLRSCQRTGFLPFLLLLSWWLPLKAATSRRGMMAIGDDSHIFPHACLSRRRDSLTSYGSFPRARKLLHPNLSKLVLPWHWPKVT